MENKTLKIELGDKASMAKLINQGPDRPYVRFVSRKGGKCHVQQAAKDECDINQIMKRFKATGVLPVQLKQNGQYGDFTADMDYQASLNAVMAAQAQFNKLPARIRSRFENDPGQFIEFMNNPANGQELIDLGLATPRAPKEPEKTENAAKTEKKAKAGTPPEKGGPAKP
ncbi:MAG: internal scaffolding protein [Microvirus sp.]|nr:MAG: internal scaffolding protein [Microvirus sp.]